MVTKNLEGELPSELTFSGMPITSKSDFGGASEDALRSLMPFQRALSNPRLFQRAHNALYELRDSFRNLARIGGLPEELESDIVFVQAINDLLSRYEILKSKYIGGQNGI